MPTEMSEGYEEGQMGAGLGTGPVDNHSMGAYGQEQYDDDEQQLMHDLDREGRASQFH